MFRALAVVAALIVASVACAQEPLLYPLQQERFVTIWTPWPEDTQSSAATGFEDWYVNLELTPFPPQRVASSQISEIGTTTLDVYGASDARLSGDQLFVQNCARVRFAVAEPVAYELLGYISLAGELFGDSGEYSWPSLSGATSVVLRQVAGPTVYTEQIAAIVDRNTTTAFVEQELNGAGILHAGVYELSMVGTLDGYSDSYPCDLWLEQSFVVCLELAPAPPPETCNADTDGDGDVDLLDFAATQRCFTGPAPN